MLVAILIIQLIIQLVLYNSIKFLFGSAIIWILKLTYKITKDVNKVCKIYQIILLFINIGISIVVAWFTAAGAIAGITNLGASCLLGLYMAYDAYKLKKMLNNK